MVPISSEEMIREYVRLLRQTTPANHVSYFLPAAAHEHALSLLIHEGAESGVPELATLEAAARFVREMGPSPRPWVRSVAENGWLVRVPCVRPVLQAGGRRPDVRDRRSGEPGDALADEPDAWLGVTLDGSCPIEDVLARTPVLSAPQTAEASTDWWNWTMGVGGTLAWHRRAVSTLLDDPISGLPGRSYAQPMIQQMMRGRDGDPSGATLILINPDGFESVNKRLGREAGDRAIREIATRVRSCTRRTDLPFRYGGAVFAVTLLASNDDGIRRVVDAILKALSEKDYLDGRLRLTFSLGIGSHTPRPGDDAASAMLTLIRRADHALNEAKTDGGARVVNWRPGMGVSTNNQRDRLTGIFTADPARDYRNMLLLWETVRAVSSRVEDFDALAPNVLKRLAHAFGAAAVAIFELKADGELVATVRHEEAAAGSNDLDHPPVDRIAEARDGLIQRILPGTDPERRFCAVPFMNGGTSLGTLYLEGPANRFQLDPPDALFLEGLTAQLSRAIERSRQAATERERQATEKQNMQSELRELRDALGRAKLVHVSASMDRLLEVARRAAVTDATVLVSGDSGTGKELIARTVHELSPRRNLPLVVVDCSAITATLMESELFGHERGAYTGADRPGPGRLKEADGGTVLLDEVGELPLEVQSKLLRFVQDKQFTPVGGTRPISVDVRLIAATNRDLAEEIRHGRFRSDLYYRLRVVHLDVPPLRDRSDDVQVLAQHFVRQFGLKYQKPVEGFTEEARRALIAHDWPGNVRELCNRVLQAVVLSEDRLLTPLSLGFDGNARDIDATSMGPAPEPALEPAVESTIGDPWFALLQALGLRIDEIAAGGPAHLVPLGKWIEHDLVLAAHSAAGEVATRGAETLGIPETTFRRRLRRAAGEEISGQAVRPEGWDEVRGLIDRVIAELDNSEEDLMERARDEVVLLLEDRLQGDVKRAAALMGVTEPTYRRWRSACRREAADVAD